MPKIDINKKRGYDAIVPLTGLWSKFDSGILDGRYCVPVGRNKKGEDLVIDLRKHLHILVAGGAYSGVGMFKRLVLVTLLKYNSPEDMKFILIDPIRISFFYFNNIEDRLLFPIVKENSEAIKTLEWVKKEMLRRYDILSENRVRDIYRYNELNKTKKIPDIIVVISEIGELIDCNDYVISIIGSIVLTSKYSGIHFIITTQRPTRDVLTSFLISNISTKLAFQNGDIIFGRRKIDKLLGQGDLIIESFEHDLERAQGYCMEEDEIAKIIF